MTELATFGRAASAAGDAGELLALEAQAVAGARFADIDDLIGDLLVRSLTGERIVALKRGRQNDTIAFDGLTPERRAVVKDRYLPANQHARGAWFIPEKVSLKLGLLSYPATFAAQPRFASGLAWDERARLVLGDSPDGVLAWSVLEPLFEQLFLPFELRGRLSGTLSREDQRASWAAVDELFASLRLDVSSELAIMRYGGGWSALRSSEQLAAKRHLLDGLASRATPELANRYRAHRLLPLIGRYYANAKNGRAQRNRVLTRPLEKTLSGFFGGDWLAFVAYLGEKPHDDEEIAVAIPKIKLIVGGTANAAAIAAEKGLPAAEVERMLATFWQTGAQQAPGPQSPVEERVGVLERLWRTFDDLHGRQASGMPSLWGLVETSRNVQIGWEGPEWYHPRQYQELLPVELNRDIERLWGSVMLPRWPDRVVTEIAPHALMAEAFGAGLDFWNGCALTTWFLCEGPFSRTDLAGLATYHQDSLAVLQRLGCPIDPKLFTELQDAQKHLGPPQAITTNKSTHEVMPGVSFEISTSTGSRRSGFERLRDIVTRHRRAWAEQYLGPYLRSRWEAEIGDAARVHAEAIAEHGKPPTAKQFARHAERAVNHWFGGDLEAFYVAIGEKAPIHPKRVRVLPQDPRAFAVSVFERLGGRPFPRAIIVTSREEGREQAAEQDRTTKLGWLAEQSLHFLQLEEALGRTPTLKEFGASGFEYRSAILAADVGAAWERYAAVVQTARNETPDAGPPAPRPVNRGIDSRTQELAETRRQDQDRTGPAGRRSWIQRLLHH